MQKSHYYIREYRGYRPEVGPCGTQIYMESGKSSLKHPRMRSNAGQLGATSPSRYLTSLRGEDAKEAG